MQTLNDCIYAGTVVLVSLVLLSLVASCGDTSVDYVPPTPYNGVPLHMCDGDVTVTDCTDADHRYYFNDGWASGTCDPVPQFECWTYVTGTAPDEKDLRLCVKSCTETHNDQGKMWAPQ